MQFRIAQIRYENSPIPFKRPLSFGRQRVDTLEKLRVFITVCDIKSGETADGLGEVPLNYPWFWPDSPLKDPSVELNRISSVLRNNWMSLDSFRHPLVAASDFQDDVLPSLFIRESSLNVPFLAWQVINAAFDIALYDGVACLLECGVYDLFQNLPVSTDYFFRSHDDIAGLMKSFRFGDYIYPMPASLGVWHMVGILDPLEGGDKPLAHWIRAGRIKRLKIKLTADCDRDLERLEMIYGISDPLGVEKYSLDYNGPGEELGWVCDFLGRLEEKLPGFYKRLSLIEQPVAAGITGGEESIRCITDRKRLLVDEGAGNWKELYKYYKAGWSGVALKICKSQTSSILMFALSRVMNKYVTVMDLTNSSLAQISHVQLAAHLSDDGEIESNGIQYCPGASRAESVVHPGLFARRNGSLDLSSLKGPGYGYRMNEIEKIRKASCC